MQPDMRDEPRAMNDSRKRTSEAPRTETPAASAPGLRQRWSDSQPTKTVLFWACIASVILTVVIGFTFGGWVTTASAQDTAEKMAKDAVVQRLAPICFANFNQDPDKSMKFDELNEISTYQRAKYVQDQGWATISGEENPDRNVAAACSQLILEMSP